MSTIESLTLWNEGVKKMEKGEYNDAIKIFCQVPEKSAKILFNTSVCKIILGQIQESLKFAEEVLSRDEHMAVGYHLKGIINFKLNKFKEACTDFDIAHSKLRGRNVIDYNQLGLRYKLYACEPLHNSGVCWGVQGNRPKAMDLLWQANRCKAETRHAAIDKSISAIDAGNKAEVMVLPFADLIYRPPKTKMANLQKKDYLGKAKVITAVDSSDVNPGFEAPRKMSQGLLQIDLPPIKPKSAPNSPRGKRKNPQTETQDRTSLLDKVGEGAAKLKQILPGGLKPSKSDSNLKDKDVQRKFLPPPPSKPLPPPPDKPAPQPPGQANTHKRPNKPLPKPPQQKQDQYIYAEETDRLEERIHRWRQVEEIRHADFNDNISSKPLMVKSNGTGVKPQIIISSSDIAGSRLQKQLPPVSSISKDIEEEGPPLPPRSYSSGSAVLPPKPQIKNTTVEDNKVTVELTCNGSVNFQVAKGSSLASLQESACKKFTLEPGTVDIWYKRAQDEEFMCIENEDAMTRLWAGVRDKLSLWCFSKD